MSCHMETDLFPLSAFLETVARGPLLYLILDIEKPPNGFGRWSLAKVYWLCHFSTQTSSIVSIFVWFIWLLNDWSNCIRYESFLTVLCLIRFIFQSLNVGNIYLSHMDSFKPKFSKPLQIASMEFSWCRVELPAGLSMPDLGPLSSHLPTSPV